MRGDVLRVKSHRNATGHEQRGERFAVVVQADQFDLLSTLVVCPTSTSAAPTVFRPEIEINGRPTLVLVDQVSALDFTRVVDRVAHLGHDDMTEVDRVLKRFLNLS